MHRYDAHTSDPLYRHLLRCRARLSDDENGCPAPCPRCQRPLVVRCGRQGPYFHCGCAPATPGSPRPGAAGPGD